MRSFVCTDYGICSELANKADLIELANDFDFFIQENQLDQSVR